MAETDQNATGDKSAQSYGWSTRLSEAVPDGGSVTFPAPGFDTQYTDVRYAEATVTSIGAVWRTGEGSVVIEFSPEEPPTVTVANTSTLEWPAGDTLYVFCPHVLAEGHNQWDIKGQIWDMQKRLVALEDEVFGAEAEEEAQAEPERAPRPKKVASGRR